MLREKILAMIVGLVEPGYSEFSRVDVDCGVNDCRDATTESATAECEESRRQCEETILAMTGRKARYNFSNKAMRSQGAYWPGWTRAETRMEAMERFAMVSVAMEYVEKHPPPSWRSTTGAPYPISDLYRGEGAVGRHESAFWRSIHEGRIRGAAGEWGLFQIHPSVLPSLGVEGPDIVGLDYESTVRSVQAAAELLGRARRLCPPSEEGWFGPTIAAYGSGQGCAVTDEWVDARIVTFEKTPKFRPVPRGGSLALYFTAERIGDEGWRPTQLTPPRSVLPDVRVIATKITTNALEECKPSMVNTPCLQRMPYTEVSRALASMAVQVWRAHKRDPVGTEIHFDDKGTRYVAKLEPHENSPKGLSVFVLAEEDFCGSGGDETCHDDDTWQP
jgi:hypothetical protein